MVGKLQQAAMLLMGFFLAQVVLFSTYSCWHNQQEYAHDGGTALPPLLMQLAENPVLRLLAHTCGYASGYGFYAPRVGSHFLTEFRLYTAGGPQEVRHYPPLKTLEGRIRYRAFSDVFSGLLPHPHEVATPKLQRQVSQAIAQSLSERLAALGTAIRVECRVGVWYPAPLRPSRGYASHYIELFDTCAAP
ncbi:hypothetical protein ACFOET_11640 [Parapedobacter deserti]|uniref:Uncharacterized protein n=1 Tax=Parapedobacter deserti TaxID=1912957 RepID=A0ABV7JMZ8_9SPHI